MRFVDRGTEEAPAGLEKKDAMGKSERDRVREHLADPSRSKSFEFTAYKDEEVKRRLEALFHSKCAYCETFYAVSAPVDIEHFRPKGAVSEDKAHPGYWWLAMAWDNLLPSCIDCNRKRKQIVPEIGQSLAELQKLASSRAGKVDGGKKDSFPIRNATARCQPESFNIAAEGALLLDPCRDKPEGSLRYHLDGAEPLGLILPTGSPEPDDRGVASIHIYGLNRLGLVQARTRLLRHLEFLGEIVVELTDMSVEVQTDRPEIAKKLRLLRQRILDELKAMSSPEAPYSSMVTAWLRRFRKKLGGP